MGMNRQELMETIKAYQPFNEQEEMDKALILNWIETQENAFSRDNTVAHMTASAWVVNKDRSKVLMVYHNIYHSWSWLGGHADGETDLLAVAIREVKEEAGISSVRPVSEEIFFPGISDGRRTCETGQLCIQSSPFKCHLSVGSRFGGARFGEGR